MIRTEIRLPDETAEFAKNTAKKQGMSFNAFITNIVTEMRVYEETNSKWEQRVGKVFQKDAMISLQNLRKKTEGIRKGDEIPK